MIASDFFDRLLCRTNNKDGPQRWYRPWEEDAVMEKFLATLQAGLVLFAVAWSGVGSASDTGRQAGDLNGADTAAMSSDEMTGAYFMRDTLVPRADDLALIQRKPALYVASFNDGMATVAYSLAEGRIVYRVVSGTVDDTARDAIDHALVRLQRKLA
ncbi:hypothetical protein [Novosphingobium sp.]|uniref:hypothetical protein n=1 Tax=Novosphingobium sp. TaxID=1874826 RepID=UPI0025F500E4|nr:hypothetical protein [Novosphingobium sp.]